MPKLSVSAGVLLQSEGDTNMVVLGMGVIWREFGDGVSMSDRYLRICIGVRPVLGALFGTKVWGPSGGVTAASSLIGQSFVAFSFSSNTFSKKKQGNWQN